jgi:hypothetical protein
MVLRESLDPDNSLWDWVAVDLFFWRNRSTLSCAQLGQKIYMNRQGVSNLEAGRLRLDLKRAQALDELWDLNGHFQRLVRFAKAGHDADWFREHLKYEARATSIKLYELAIVPGLLQTAAYTRAILAYFGGQNLDERVEARMARQEILDRPNPPLMKVLLAESVLDWQVGGATVLKAQLAKLLSVSERHDVMLRVVEKTTGYHCGLAGSFKVLTAPGGPVAYTEANLGGRLITDPSEVREFDEAFDRIGVDALHQSASRDLIRQRMDAL